MEYNRLYFINRLVKEKKFRSYLEIGVFLGKIFFNISAKKKIAVDPYFRFGFYRKFKRIFKNITNLNAKFFEKTSDAFFAEDAANLFADTKLDICLVDGMHEYQFALRDVENSLRYLQKQGVIIMHDCNPQTATAAISFEEWKSNKFQGVWNGDVWKTIVHLRSSREDVNVFVLDCDEGLGVVTFGKPENKLNFTPHQIDAFSYAEFSENRKEWLNLKPASYFFEYFGMKEAVSNEQ
ncbi:MAG: class I SAM-dependent methyltransferase [Flavisolibacter sp.]